MHRKCDGPGGGYAFVLLCALNELLVKYFTRQKMNGTKSGFLPFFMPKKRTLLSRLLLRSLVQGK